MSYPIEDIANWLTGMPLDLPIYQFAFPSDVVCCIGIFPAGTKMPIRYDSVGAIDVCGVQVQVRYTDAGSAYYRAEAIKAWLDNNPPTGYYLLQTNQSQARDMTSELDLQMEGGPAYRWEVSFDLCRVRA